MTLTSIITSLLSILSITAQLIIGLVIAAKIFRKNKLSERFMKLIGKNVLFISFIVALIAMSGSLFYSEIAGYEPCKLCWYQRILMYPLVIIFGIALWKKDNLVRRYAIPLSVIGIAIASYHYALQLGLVDSSSCSAISGAVSCAKTYTMNYGYITIPMMALSAFALIFALMAISKDK